MKKNLKKMLSTLLVVTLCVGSTMTVYAKEKKGDTSSSFSVQKSPGVSAEKRDKKSKAGVDFETTDTVTIKDGTCMIRTEDWRILSITPSFGWVALSQDLSQQYQDFASVFVDPVAVVEAMKKMDTHLILMDNSTGVEVDVHISKNEVSKNLTTARDMGSSKEKKFMDSLEEITGFSCETKDLGLHHYFVLTSKNGKTYGDDNMSAMYITYCSGYQIDYQVYTYDSSNPVVSDSVLEEIETMLKTVVML